MLFYNASGIYLALRPASWTQRFSQGRNVFETLRPPGRNEFTAIASDFYHNITSFLLTFFSIYFLLHVKTKLLWVYWMSKIIVLKIELNLCSVASNEASHFDRYSSCYDNGVHLLIRIDTLFL